MVMIVDNAVAAEPLVTRKLVVKMDEIVGSGEVSWNCFTIVLRIFHVRQGLRGYISVKPNSASTFAEVTTNGVDPLYCAESLGVGSHESFGRSLSIPRDSGVL